MYCRVCKNIRQDRDGKIYCVLTCKGVGLNQVCHIDKCELDKRILEDVVHNNEFKGDR